MKATIVSATDGAPLDSAVTTARSAISAQKTIVIPTDTVYGIAADAFSLEAVSALLAAKGRSRQMPPPVLIFDQSVLPGLADQVSADAQALAEEFWPGPLTLIFYAQPSLNWDLGDTQGTVALRVPNDPFALELLRAVGPLAVSSANKTGRPAATTAAEAFDQLGNDVEVIIDAGPRPEGRAEDQPSHLVKPSTIVDCTSDRLVVVREGAISVEQLRQLAPGIMTRAEFEAQERARQEGQAASQQTGQALAASNDTASTALAPGGGEHRAEEEAEPGFELARPAAQAQAGSLASSLLTPVSGEVDQRRTRQAQQGRSSRPEPSTPPLSREAARFLVFGPSDSQIDLATEPALAPEAAEALEAAQEADS
ncbi:MAG: L-threonylcarbamoyladenylate synthase [Rothia sp. (in: high G+C Gram-positive bacteria)]|nr:L-threonylcarbamoyladenylate synthase [Rothia sp. (in: high G+C Gram-positive bacteria)]